MDAVRAFVNRLYLEIFYEKKKVINFFDNIFLKKSFNKSSNKIFLKCFVNKIPQTFSWGIFFF